jgi:hypothetical protein
MSYTESFAAGLRRPLIRMRAAWIARRTRLAIEGLPENLRKDIGWPDGPRSGDDPRWRS